MQSHKILTPSDDVVLLRARLEAMEFREIVRFFIRTFWENPLPVAQPAKANLVERIARRKQAELDQSSQR